METQVRTEERQRTIEQEAHCLNNDSWTTATNGSNDMPTPTPTPVIPLTDDDDAPSSASLAPFNPISDTAARIVLDLLHLQPTDVLHDPGCGDGRFLVQACEHVDGLRCTGVEYDPSIHRKALDRIAARGLTDRIRVTYGDALRELKREVGVETEAEAEVDASEGSAPDRTHPDRSSNSIHNDDDWSWTALYLYLLPDGLERVRPLLERLLERKRRNPRARTSLTTALSRHDEEPWHCPNDKATSLPPPPPPDVSLSRQCPPSSLRVVSYMFAVRGWNATEVVRTPRTGCALYLYDWTVSSCIVESTK